MASLYHLLIGCLCLTQIINGQGLTILVTEWNPGQIYHVSLTNRILNPVNIRRVARPVAVDYDPQTRDIYWTDVQLKEINAINILGTNERKIVSLNISSVPDGLAVDATNRKLFYTDAGYDVIISMDVDGTNKRVIINSGLDQPRAIVLHEEIRKFYFADWGSSPYIASADYDGRSITKIVTSGLGWPNGLTLDKQTNILYWCDAQTHKIESVNVNGTHRRMLINEPLAHYFDIFFIQGTLFFTDWNRRAILHMPANGGTVGGINSERFQHLAGLHIFSNATACPDNHYGSPCTSCGRCANGDVCNPISGYCPSGCQTGWTGDRCDRACPSKTYGQSCADCGRCAGGVACNNVTGECPDGCQDGWSGSQCSTKCTVGTYGPRCQSVCGNCLGGLCNYVDGRCESGCTSGYQGDACKTVKCSTNSYGSTCVPCGRCANGDVCNQLTGNCPSGCLDGWVGNKCDQACPANTYGNSCTDCGHCVGGEACDRVNGACPGECQDGWMGSRCNNKVSDSESLPLVVVVGAAAGGVAVLLIVVIIIVIVAIVVLRRKKTPKPQTDEDPHYASLDSVRQSNIYSVPDVALAYSTISDAQTGNPMDGYTGLKETQFGVSNLGYASQQSPGQHLEDYVDAIPQSLEGEQIAESVQYDRAVA